MTQSKVNWELWDTSLKRTFWICSAVGSIFLIGLQIGRSMGNSSEDQVSNKLAYIIDHIDNQAFLNDSLASVMTNKTVDTKYLSLDNFETELTTECTIDNDKISVDLITDVFDYLGDGIHDYQVFIEQFKDGKWSIVHFVEPQIIEVQLAKSYRIRRVLRHVFIGTSKLDSRLKCRVKLRIGSYKNYYGEFKC